MPSEYFNDYVKPLTDELERMLDEYEIPFSEVSEEEACTYCGNRVPFNFLLWSDHNNPYCSIECLDNNTEEFGKGYKAWLGRKV